MTRKTAVARLAIIVCSVLFTMVVAAQQITLKPGAIPDKAFHRANARDFAYCEIDPCGQASDGSDLQQQWTGRPLPSERDGCH